MTGVKNKMGPGSIHLRAGDAHRAIMWAGKDVVEEMEGGPVTGNNPAVIGQRRQFSENNMVGRS